MKPMRTIAVGGFLLYVLLATPGVAHAQYKATPFSDPATGEAYHAEAGLAFWNPPPSLVVQSEALGIVGSQIDAVNDLGIQQKRITELRFVLRPAKKHKFRINYLPMTYQAETTVHRQFVFNGISYGLNLPVTTDLSWKTWQLGYEYDFYYSDRGFAGFVTQLRVTDVDVKLAAPGLADFVTAKAPIPTIGGVGRVYVAPNISITGEFGGIKLPDKAIENTQAHYWDFDLYGTINFNPYLGAQIGYRSLDVGYLVKKDMGAFKMRGIYFGGVARY